MASSTDILCMGSMLLGKMSQSMIRLSINMQSRCLSDRLGALSAGIAARHIVMKRANGL